jgi:hypothetical protein
MKETTAQRLEKKVVSAQGTPATPVADLVDIRRAAPDEFKKLHWMGGFGKHGKDEEDRGVELPPDPDAPLEPGCFEGMAPQQGRGTYYDRRNSKLPATVMVAKADGDRLAAAQHVELSLGIRSSQYSTIFNNNRSTKSHNLR